MGFNGSGWGFSGGGSSGSGIPLTRLRFGVELSGTRNGVNQTFTTPEKFLPDTIRVYFNGQRHHEGGIHDYTLVEGGGVGSGYDTVVFAVVAPLADEHVLADYITLT